jgi:GTP cyclohydrolase I
MIAELIQQLLKELGEDRRRQGLERTRAEFMELIKAGRGLPI